MTMAEQSKLAQTLRAYKTKAQGTSLTQKAYWILLTAIRELTLQPGKSFLEREIVDLLEMSRTPIHEALIRLEVEGWITIIPRKGFTVAPILEATITEISQISESLDGLAAQLAAENMANQDIAQLEMEITLQEKAMYDNDLKEYVNIDQKFHQLIINHVSNNRLKTLIGSYSDQLYRARLYTINDRQFPMHSIQEHRAIVAALQIKDGSAARQLMEFHRERGGKEIAHIIQQKAAGNNANANQD